MALFSRRKKDDDASNEPKGAKPAAAEPNDGDAASSTEPPASVAETAPEVVPQVGISVSTYRGAAAPAPTPGITPAAAGASFGVDTSPAPGAPEGNAPIVRGQETAPDNAETVPGLRDNVLVREALAALSNPPTQGDLADVARQLMQGHLFLRVKGDARELLEQGGQLPLAIAKQGDKSYLVVYSSGRALQDAVKADGDAQTSALGQPTHLIIQHVLAGNADGIILDGSSAQARALLPREVLEQALKQADPESRVKTLLAGSRTESTASEIAGVIADGAPLWVALGEAGKDESGNPKYGVAEGRTAEGRRFVELYSHPLEVLAMRRGNRAMPVTTAQLTSLVRGNPAIAGVVLDPGGPWIQIPRDVLEPVFQASDAAAQASDAPTTGQTDAAGDIANGPSAEA